MIAVWLALGLLAGSGGVTPPDPTPVATSVSGGGTWWPEPRRKKRKDLEEQVEAAVEVLAPEIEPDTLQRQLDVQLARYAAIPLPQIDVQAIARDVVAQWHLEVEAHQALVTARKRRDEEHAVLLLLSAL